MLYSNKIWHIPKLVSICLKNRHQIDDFWRFLKILELFQSFHQITDIVIKEITRYYDHLWLICQTGAICTIQLFDHTKSAICLFVP